MTVPRRIAMWSGPRNISTAMMRSWGSRLDTFVTDEPLYAYYLHETGFDHPGAQEVMQSQPTEWMRVSAWLLGDVPEQKSIWYQKHMAHHLLPGVDRAWIDKLTNIMLIREPRAMLTSLARVIPNPSVDQTGLPQQVELFERLSRNHGQVIAVLDARDVLEHPEAMLRALCERIEVPFDPAMLSWESGPRETDGVWARYWYSNVEASTGFSPYVPPKEEVPAELNDVLEVCQRAYDRLYEHRLRP
ncbi:MAG: hypothetical protein KC983_03020 [Phycisphaerales bacterium]|nr:hypothetical protein [Phycisphaerales bacterium]